MKKKMLSLLLALVICFGLIPTTALAAAVTLNVDEKRTISCRDGTNHSWRVDDSSIVDYDPKGSSCTITGRKPGATVVWVSYEIKIPRPAIGGGTEYDSVTENASWSVVVKDPSAPTPPTVSALPTPNKSYGNIGDDVSGIITDIKGFNCGVVPVEYNGLWGLANAELELLVPFRFKSISEITNSGYMVVKQNDSDTDYIINTECEVAYAYSRISGSDLVWCKDGYFRIHKVYDKRKGIFVNEDYNYQGEEITASESDRLNNVWLRTQEERGDLYRFGYAEADGHTVWTFCKPTEQYKDSPNIVLKMDAYDGCDPYSDLQEGLLLVSERYDSPHLMGAVDKNGKLVIPLEYDFLYPSSCGWLAYKKGDEYGLLENPVNPPSGEVVKPSVPNPDPAVEDIPASGTAYAAGQTVRVDGIPVKFYTYVLRDAGGGDTNYVRLRDVAYVLSGTGAQFEVKWDGETRVTTSRPYTAVGGEMTAIFTGDQIYRGGAVNVQIDGRTVPLTAIVLTDAGGGGNTYFKLRDLGAALGFDVAWSAGEGITIHTK